MSTLSSFNYRHALVVVCMMLPASAVWAGEPIEPVVCHECRGPVTPLGPAWWARASERMRAAGRRDRKLLGQIQAEWRGEHGDVALPPLSEPFAWLNALWAGQRAPGRPLDSLGHFVLAHMVGRLQAAGVSLNQIFRLASIPDLDQRRAAARNLPDSARRFVGADLDGILAQLPFISDRAEFKRRLRWAIRQWTDPGARFRGERVRSR